MNTSTHCSMDMLSRAREIAHQAAEWFGFRLNPATRRFHPTAEVVDDQEMESSNTSAIYNRRTRHIRVRTPFEHNLRTWVHEYMHHIQLTRGYFAVGYYDCPAEREAFAAEYWSTMSDKDKATLAAIFPTHAGRHDAVLWLHKYNDTRALVRYWDARAIPESWRQHIGFVREHFPPSQWLPWLVWLDHLDLQRPKPLYVGRRMRLTINKHVRIMTRVLTATDTEA